MSDMTKIHNFSNVLPSQLLSTLLLLLLLLLVLLLHPFNGLFPGQPR